jgi:hypothetical protein
VELKNTLKNLKRTKNSFFNLKESVILNMDLCKNNMVIIFDCVTIIYSERIVIYEKININKWEFFNDTINFLITKNPIYKYKGYDLYGYAMKNKTEDYKCLKGTKFLIRLYPNF